MLYHICSKHYTTTAPSFRLFGMLCGRTGVWQLKFIRPRISLAYYQCSDLIACPRPVYGLHVACTAVAKRIVAWAQSQLLWIHNETGNVCMLLQLRSTNNNKTKQYNTQSVCEHVDSCTYTYYTETGLSNSSFSWTFQIRYSIFGVDLFTIRLFGLSLMPVYHRSPM